MHQIFVSYARVDDVPPGESTGWVTEFASQLSLSLASWFGSRSVKVFTDNASLGNEPLEERLRQRVQESSALVIVMSEGWLNSTRWCWEELYAFVSAHGFDSKRIWIVRIQPIENERFPAEIAPLVALDFFAQIDGAPQRLGYPVPLPREHQSYFNQINLLAWQIRQALVPGEAGKAPPTVWLGDPADSALSDWRELAAAVQQANFLISPSRPGAYSAVDAGLFEGAVKADLQTAMVRAQLFGLAPGKPSAWSRVPLDHLQKMKAGATVGNADSPPLFWRSPATDVRTVVDPAHGRLFGGLTSCTMSELQATVIARARDAMRKRGGAQVDTPAPAGDAGVRVSVSAYGQDVELGQHARLLLQARNLKVKLTPEQAKGEPPGEYRQRLEESLSSTDAVLIVQRAVPPVFVGSMLQTVEKVIGHRNRYPLWGGLLLGKAPEPGKPGPALKPGVEVFNAWQGVEPAVDQFVRRLTGGAQGAARA